MDDLIRRSDVEAAIIADSVGRYCPPEPVDPYSWALSFVTDIPAVDAVAVVRCRECIYYNNTGCADGFGWCEDSVVNTGVFDSWFCANGKRREDGDGDG